MKFLIALSFLMLSFSAFATDLIFAWDTPTHREDGSPLIETDIDGFRIYHSVDAGPEQVINVPAGTNSYTFVDVVYGVHSFSISTISDGLEGGKSSVFQESVFEVFKPDSPMLTRVILEHCFEVDNCARKVIFEGVQ